MKWLALSIVMVMLTLRVASSLTSVSIPAFRPVWVRSTVRLFAATSGGYVPSIQAKDIIIPMEKIEFNFARSSGPGGQNVNKLNTKAEIRFHVDEADWIAPEVKQRLVEYNANRISKEGFLIIACQEHRTQMKNKSDCIEKLKEMIAEASIEPKERQMWEGIGEKGKAIRREQKKHRSEVKNTRRMSKDWD
eukprot:gene7948-8768_t